MERKLKHLTNLNIEIYFSFGLSGAYTAFTVFYLLTNRPPILMLIYALLAVIFFLTGRKCLLEYKCITLFYDCVYEYGDESLLIEEFRDDYYKYIKKTKEN